MKYTIVLICAFVLLISCDTNKSKYSFYHWKTDAIYTPTISTALNATKTKKIYLHYFDIETKNIANEYGENIFPTYVIQNIAKEYKNYKIIPTVFISNSVFSNQNTDIKNLAEKVDKLISQISLDHFKKEHKEIQIDCDWSQSTKNSYFEFLKLLQNHYEVSVTIRLHQIKFQEKTGIPPVKKGTLMVYNVGDLKNISENSILESKIVAQYINKSSHYPLELNIALPLFSQTVIFNNENKIRLSSYTEKEMLENDAHFEAVSKNLFTVVQDTLLKGFYLSEGFQLKLEDSNEKEIVNSYKIIKNSKLKTEEIIFYHLDDKSLKNIDLNQLIKKL